MTPEKCDQAAAEGMDVRETFKLASEFAPNVTVTEETFFGHGWQPLTITLLQSLWFLPSDATFDVPFLVDWYQRIGWKGANGQPLGEKVIRRELGLLKKAGYVTMTRLRGEGGKAVGIQYGVSKRRLDQPQDGAWVPTFPGSGENPRSHHMAPMATRGGSPHVVDGENPRSHHMAPMATRGESPHVVDGEKPQVAPHGTNASPPPHPPEEEDSSSSNLLTRTVGPLPSQREAEAAFTPEEITAAEDFLQQMQRWQAGARTARTCAKPLLNTMRRQGWPSIVDLNAGDRALLESDVLKNTGGATSWTKCLPGWVADLRRYSAVRSHQKAAQDAAAPSSEGRQMCRKPGHGAGAYAADDCPKCHLEARGPQGPADDGLTGGAALLARGRALLAAKGELAGDGEDRR